LDAKERGTKRIRGRKDSGGITGRRLCKEEGSPASRRGQGGFFLEATGFGASGEKNEKIKDHGNKGHDKSNKEEKMTPATQVADLCPASAGLELSKYREKKRN